MRFPQRMAVASLVCAMLPALALAGGYVGQVVTPGTSIDGVAVPVGTTVYPNDVIETGDAPGVVQLAGGQLIRVAESSRAVVTREPEGVRLAVLAGAAGYLDGGGGIALGIGDEAELSEEGGGVGEGVPVPPGDPSEDVAICVLKDSTPRLVKLCNVEEPDNRSDCKWYRKRVERRDLAAYFARGAVYADKDLRTEGMNPDVECGRRAGAIWPSTVAGVVGVAVLGEELEVFSGVVP